MTTTHKRADPRVRRARIAVAAIFAVHGAVTGNFAARVPWVQEHTGISPGQLGIALAFPAIGASVAMPLAGRISRRFGSRAALRGLLVLWCAALVPPAFAPGLLALCAALAVYGATAGMADVAMNALGVETEDRLGRSIMSSLHGMWSVGGLVGAAVGAVAAHADVDARIQFVLAATALAVIGAVACRWVLDLRTAAEERPTTERSGGRGRGLLPPRSALLIGAVGFCAVFAEGASLDWSAVYLREVVGSGPGVAAACTTVFSCTMAAARFAGDAAVRRFGPVRTVRVGGVAATAGGVLVVTAAGPVPAIAGFGLVGLGIAVVVPLAFAAAGRSGADPSRAIATVATVTYTSGLIAPAAIGQIADATSLVVSFSSVTALTAGLVAGAGVLRAPARGASAHRAASATKT
ncbi:MFS transporter [Streptomyces netropsis]|uniref:Fucose permease n=1 Tax=Streptomyces netropsis TaxID=55404 RepID=A0A7W7PD49_STRNE|nr:MFS transporter [Streptomyces netropsis]MBB4886416.1 fucose permease [Streptomyces netropsis]GGR20064.1 MFS transporter [Streptomyces netropsis]